MPLDNMPLDTTEAVAELIRLIALGASPETLRCLSACPACRNSLMYLLDTPAAPERYTLTVMARLAALPRAHESHRPGHPDFHAPQVRGFSS